MELGNLRVADSTGVGATARATSRPTTIQTVSSTLHHTSHTHTHTPPLYHAPEAQSSRCHRCREEEGCCCSGRPRNRRRAGLRRCDSTPPPRESADHLQRHHRRSAAALSRLPPPQRHRRRSLLQRSLLPPKRLLPPPKSPKRLLPPTRSGIQSWSCPRSSPRLHLQRVARGQQQQTRLPRLKLRTHSPSLRVGLIPARNLNRNRRPRIRGPPHARTRLMAAAPTASSLRSCARPARNARWPSLSGTPRKR